MPSFTQQREREREREISLISSVLLEGSVREGMIRLAGLKEKRAGERAGGETEIAPLEVVDFNFTGRDPWVTATNTI